MKHVFLYFLLITLAIFGVFFIYQNFIINHLHVTRTIKKTKYYSHSW
jgi:hypothetical protein